MNKLTYTSKTHRKTPAAHHAADNQEGLTSFLDKLADEIHVNIFERAYPGHLRSKTQFSTTLADAAHIFLYPKFIQEKLVHALDDSSHALNLSTDFDDIAWHKDLKSFHLQTWRNLQRAPQSCERKTSLT